jgi:hypothetical protein
MIQLIMSVAAFFLVPFIVLPCLVVIAMSLRGMLHSYRAYNPFRLEDRRARIASEFAAMNASLRYSSSDVPDIARREAAPRLPSQTTPQLS